MLIGKMPIEIQAQAGLNSFMSKQRQLGFGLVEVILIVLTLGVLGYAGWQVWQAQVNKSDTSNNTTPTTSEETDPYDGWNEHNFVYEKFSLRYPSSFTLKETSAADEYVNTGGTDRIELSKPNDFKLTINTGIHDVGGACEKCTVIDSQNITFLGKSLYLNYVDQVGDGKVRYALLSTDTDDWFGGTVKGVNIKLKDDNNEPLPISVSLRYTDGSENFGKTLEEFKSSPDVAEAIKILESAKY